MFPRLPLARFCLHRSIISGVIVFFFLFGPSSFFDSCIDIRLAMDAIRFFPYESMWSSKKVTGCAYVTWLLSLWLFLVLLVLHCDVALFHFTLDLGSFMLVI
jgi:hypothetical protein